MTGSNSRSIFFDELTQTFRNKAIAAKLKSRTLSLQVKDPKFGDRKRAHFLQEQKHFKRLADGYNRAARDIMYLKGKNNEVDVATPSPVPELETVGYVGSAINSQDDPLYTDFFKTVSNPENFTAVVSRDQAEGIIADLVKEIERLKSDRLYVVGCNDGYETAEAELAKLKGQVPVAVLRFDRSAGHENEMPKVVSCNWQPDGEYKVYLHPVADREAETIERYRVALKLAGELLENGGFDLQFIDSALSGKEPS